MKFSNSIQGVRKEALSRETDVVVPLDDSVASAELQYEPSVFFGLTGKQEVLLDHADPLRVIEDTRRNEACPFAHPGFENVDEIRNLAEANEGRMPYFGSPGEFAYYAFRFPDRVTATFKIKGSADGKEYEASWSWRDHFSGKKENVYYVEGSFFPTEEFSLDTVLEKIEDLKRKEKGKKTIRPAWGPYQELLTKSCGKNLHGDTVVAYVRHFVEPVGTMTIPYSPLLRYKNGGFENEDRNDIYVLNREKNIFVPLADIVRVEDLERICNLDF